MKNPFDKIDAAVEWYKTWSLESVVIMELMYDRPIVVTEEKESVRFFTLSVAEMVIYLFLNKYLDAYMDEDYKEGSDGENI